jgi:folate-dependent phosphoribosylglycinamide formyltransferase PurN
VLAVATQPDRPSGRGQHAAAPPVKQCAERLGLPVYQPERVRRPEAVEYLRALAPDAMVVVGYGQIIPQSVIDIPPLGIINVHGSLLPKYRGAGPVQWAIVNGETVTGVTTMRIDAGLDTGDMLLKAETAIGAEETAVELAGRLAEMGAELLVRTLEGLAAGAIVPEKQDPAQATYARDRLGTAGGGHPQPGAGLAAVAGRFQHFSRPDAAHLESARGGSERRRAAGAAGEREAAGGGLRRGRVGAGRSATGRAQAHVRGGFCERAASGGE